jgi:hypothetical protein
VITDFSVSLWLIIDVNSVLGLLHLVVVDDVANISELHAASFFRVKVCWLVNCCVYIAYCFEYEQGNAE